MLTSVNRTRYKGILTLFKATKASNKGITKTPKGKKPHWKRGGGGGGKVIMSQMS